MGLTASGGAAYSSLNATNERQDYQIEELKVDGEGVPENLAILNAKVDSIAESQKRILDYLVDNSSPN